MTYLSLYRKYRPQTFSEVVGQDHVTSTLANALTEDRLHHAYLFTGPRGTGKTSMARILAKAVNCERGPGPQPDNTCGQCTAISGGGSVDVIEIDAASHGGVDDVRDLRDRVAFVPASARRKVYIVDECHMLSPAGWNAFLKTVEEPPGHVLFVFATTEPHKVPPTILSRTQRFDFRRAPAETLATYAIGLAAREGVQVERAAADLLASAGDGSFRDTLSVLDQVVAYTGSTVTARGVAEALGAVPAELPARAADLIGAGDVAGLCILVGTLAEAGHDPRQFARDTIEHLRGLLLVKVAPDAGLVETTPEGLERLLAQSGRLGRVELLRAIELLAEAQAQMRRGNTRLPLEIALVKAALPEASGDPAALAARLDRLERRTGVAESAQTVPDTPPTAPARQEQTASQAARDSGPQVAAVDLELVRRSWPAVLEATKARKRVPWTLLSEASPVAAGDGTLTLSFPPRSAYHAERCGSAEFQALFADVFTQVLGVPLRLQCQVAADPVDGAKGLDTADEAEEAAVAEAEAAEADGSVPDATAARAQAIQTLARDLGATVVSQQVKR